MKRNMGLILMIIGVVCFIVGFVFYSSPKKTTETVTKTSGTDNTASTSTSFADSTTSAPPARAPQNTYSANELEKIVDMAIADGVLTPNERNLIKEFANSRGLNYNVIIRDVEKRIAASGGMAETEIVDANKKQGNDFEKFVVQKFDRKYYKIKEWAGDKFVNGVYAQTTQQPDLLIQLNLKGITSDFSVECKWKSSFFKNGIELASPEQFKRYQRYEEDKGVPVFIAVGVGGSGESPEYFFVVPLREVNSNFISFKKLQQFEKKIDSDFFYHYKNKELR